MAKVDVLKKTPTEVKSEFTTFKDAAKRYPYPLVYRSNQLHLDLMGCPYSAKTIANLECLGNSCEGAAMLGGKKAYPPLAFGAWLDEVTCKTLDTTGGAA